LDSILALLGTVLIFLIPGWVWTYIFFDPGESFVQDESRFIRGLERLALAVALSLVIVPMMVFLLNIFIEIGSTLIDSLLVTALLVLMGGALYYAKRKGALEFMRRILDPNG